MPFVEFFFFWPLSLLISQNTFKQNHRCGAQTFSGWIWLGLIPEGISPSPRPPCLLVTSHFSSPIIIIPGISEIHCFAVLLIFAWRTSSADISIRKSKVHPLRVLKLHYLSQGGYVVGWLVGWLVAGQQDCPKTDFLKTWMDEGFRP